VNGRRRNLHYTDAWIWAVPGAVTERRDIRGLKTARILPAPKTLVSRLRANPQWSMNCPSSQYESYRGYTDLNPKVRVQIAATI